MRWTERTPYHLAAVVLLAIVLASCVTTGADLNEQVSDPEPQKIHQAIVTVSVTDPDATQAGVEIEVLPETARIFVSEDGQRDPERSYQVRWVIAGPRPGWTVRIRPKEGEAEDIFDFPDRSEGRPAFHVPGNYNTHPSGAALYFPEPGDERFECHEEEIAGETLEEGARGVHRVCTWLYEVDVVDRATGEVLARIDPAVEFEDDY